MDNFGVAMTKCFYCGGDNNILINTKLTPGAKKAVEEANGKVVDMTPCPKCKAYMEKGIILIETKDNADKNNPYRTGRMCVITDDGIKDMLKENEKLLEEVLKNRFCFIEESVWKIVGLPEK